MGSLRLGIDIGGTFTDFILADTADGTHYTWKSLTTPRDPVTGVIAGLQQCLQHHQLSPAQIGLIVHATTLITNTVIERRGASTGLITTRGFGDLIEIRREVRYDLYDLRMRLPEPLVPACHRREVAERIDVDGQVVQALDEDAVREAARELIQDGVDAIAVCFLHGYRNPEHERRAAAIIREHFPKITVSCSSEVSSEIREYERFSTTVTNAYVQPVAGRYLEQLTDDLATQSISAPLFVMLSNGGFTDATEASRTPVRAIESGPAAGALIAGHIARRAGYANVLAFDMGGTTAKLCVVDNGEPVLTHNIEVARVHRFKRGSGLPLQVPSVELIEIGAGGGSIARVDELGLLSVGPQSSGADPGPASYGQGGTEPTVTDADLVLGYLNPDYFLGGRMQLDDSSAAHTIAVQIGEPLRLDVERAALGVYDVVNENMATAAGVYIAELGRDPREFTLVATGGAGPVHAAGVARRLGISRILIPPTAGVASAAGLLVAPPRIDLALSHPVRLDALELTTAERIREDLKEQAVARLAGAAGDKIVDVAYSVDMRYVNQGHEVNVLAPTGGVSAQFLDELRVRFEDVYKRLFDRTIPGVPVECITWRVTARASAEDIQLQTTGGSEMDVSATYRPVRFSADGERLSTPVFARAACKPAEWHDGPAIVEESESTTVIPPDSSWQIDAAGNLLIEMGERRA